MTHKKIRFTRNSLLDGEFVKAGVEKTVDAEQADFYIRHNRAVAVKKSDAGAPAVPPGDGAKSAPVSDPKPDAPGAPLTTAAVPPATTRGSIRGK